MTADPFAAINAKARDLAQRGRRRSAPSSSYSAACGHVSPHYVGLSICDACAAECRRQGAAADPAQLMRLSPRLARTLQRRGRR